MEGGGRAQRGGCGHFGAAGLLQLGPSPWLPAHAHGSCCHGSPRRLILLRCCTDLVGRLSTSPRAGPTLPSCLFWTTCNESLCGALRVCCPRSPAGAAPYDAANEREGDIPFEEQLRGMERVIKAGKVCSRWGLVDSVQQSAVSSR